MGPKYRGQLMQAIHGSQKATCEDDRCGYLSEVPQSSGQRNGVLSEILKNEVTVRMALAIGELPIPYREAFVLHYVEGMEYSEMAVLLGESATALRTRAMRARGLLQSSLGPVVDTWMRG